MTKNKRVRIVQDSEHYWLYECFLDRELIGTVSNFFNDDELAISFIEGFREFKVDELRMIADEIERTEISFKEDIEVLKSKTEFD